MSDLAYVASSGTIFIKHLLVHLSSLFSCSPPRLFDPRPLCLPLTDTHTIMSQTVGATTFTLFRSLPSELRNIIWVMSLPEDVQETCIFSQNKRWVREGEYPKFMMAFPWIAHVCGESRAEALRHVKTLDFEDGPQWRTAYRPFRPDLDVMVLGPHDFRDERDRGSSSPAGEGDCYSFRESLARVGLWGAVQHVALVPSPLVSSFARNIRVWMPGLNEITYFGDIPVYVMEYYASDTSYHAKEFTLRRLRLSRLHRWSRNDGVYLGRLCYVGV